MIFLLGTIRIIVTMEVRLLYVFRCSIFAYMTTQKLVIFSLFNFYLICHSSWTQYSDSEPTNLCSFSSVMRAYRRGSENQLYSFWYNSTGARTHDLPHSWWARYPLHHRCGSNCRKNKIANSPLQKICSTNYDTFSFDTTTH
jgi:hypothetical protein